MPSHVRFQLNTYLLAIKGSLSSGVFEGRTSTWSGVSPPLGSSVVQTLRQIVFIREKKLSNKIFLTSRHIRREKALLPVDVCRSKTSLLKLLNISTVWLYYPFLLYSYLSSMKSKHFDICDGEITSACKKLLLLSWWALIGSAKSTATRVCILF